MSTKDIEIFFNEWQLHNYSRLKKVNYSSETFICSYDKYFFIYKFPASEFGYDYFCRLKKLFNYKLKF